ncbi:DNA N-6-adenine-methyltransferase [Flavobacterium sp.]|uniref:DNA N-6-adenine-methyltransferase n=1 Tax=Flavobacterium sp. TaxID=239 RepID=UPI003D6B6E58
MDLFNQTPQEEPIKKIVGNAFNINTNNHDEWLTPPDLIKSLGVFDLDPCSPINRPWDTAKNHLTVNDESLLQHWEGRVWLNPPYGKYMEKFLHKMALHKNGISLIFARTETKAFQNFIFPHAESIFFIHGRITFFTVEGIAAKFNSGAPSVLIGHDEYNAEMIEQSGIKGHHVYLKQRIFIAGISLDQNKTWRVIVGEALEELKEASLSEIYETVVKLAPNRIKSNPNYKAKIRQTLQFHYEKISKGTYTLN